VNSVPRSSALEKISSFDYRNFLKTRTCRGKPVGIHRPKGSMFYFAIDYVYVFKTRTVKHEKTSQVSILINDEFVYVVQCYSMPVKCKNQNHKYCVSSDIE